MARPPISEQRRSEIIDGLARVMAVQGYAKATIQAIARAAGRTPGLVHYHFRNKQEILLALIERLSAVVRARLDPEAGDPAQRLFAAIDGLVGADEGIDTEAVACWIVIGAEAIRQPEVQGLCESSMREAIEELTTLFRAALRASGRSDETAADAALSVVAAVEGFFRLAATSPALVPTGSAAASLKLIARAYLEAAREAG